MDLIIAIATLCQVAAGAPYLLEDADKYQLKCQQYYLSCLDLSKVDYIGQIGPTKLAKCVRERQVK